MSRLSVIFTFILMSTIACTSDSNEKQEESNQNTTTETQVPQQDQLYLPSISMDDLKVLWDNCNQMDYIYYDLPISTSLSDQYSVQQSLRHISDTPVSQSVKDNCKAISRVFFKQDGEDLMEAEIYFSNGCSFFVFFKEGKPAHSNYMTDAGIKYFNDILQKALSVRPKQ